MDTNGFGDDVFKALHKKSPLIFVGGRTVRPCRRNYDFGTAFIGGYLCDKICGKMCILPQNNNYTTSIQHRISQVKRVWVTCEAERKLS
jgi:hypothetical protein